MAIIWDGCLGIIAAFQALLVKAPATGWRALQKINDYFPGTSLTEV